MVKVRVRKEGKTDKIVSERRKSECKYGFWPYVGEKMSENRDFLRFSMVL